ncbi:hypothetical protein ACU686_21480 [Yinghuangia aomiensis]
MDNVVTDAILSIGARVKEGPSSGGKPPALTTEHARPAAGDRAPGHLRRDDRPGEHRVGAPGSRPRPGASTTCRSSTVTGDPKSVTRNRRARGRSNRPRTAPAPRARSCSAGSARRARKSCGTPHASAPRPPPPTASPRRASARPTAGARRHLTLGTVPASGEVRVDVTASEAGEITQSPIGCLDLRRFADTTAELTKNGAVKVSTGGHSLNAVLPSGSRGYAVVATTAVDGWTCTVDGRTAGGGRPQRLPRRPAGRRRNERRVRLHTPGMVKGAAVSGVGIAGILVGGLVVPWVRRRLRPSAGIRDLHVPQAAGLGGRASNW